VRGVWVRPWLRAYVRAPFGAVLGTLLWGAALGAIDPAQPSVMWLLLAILAIAVLCAYVVGVLLLPVFLVYERLRWRGAHFYVPTAVLAGLLTIGVIQPPESRAAGPAALVLGALCGLGSGIVFSVRLRLPP
jgi:hypothetical protein